MAINSQAISNPKLFASLNLPGVIANSTTAPTLSASGSGGGLAAGTYYVAYTWYCANNPSGMMETQMSPIASITITAGQSIVVTVPTFPGITTTANIYIGTTSGQANMKYQAGTTSTTYTQSAALNTTNAPSPSANLTMPSIYTSPGYTPNVTSPSATAIVKEVIICNYSGATQQIYMTIDGVGFIYGLSVAAGDTKVLSGLNTMIPGAMTGNANNIQAWASSYNTSIIVSGVEVQ